MSADDDLLGTDADQYLVIHIKNVEELVRKKGGVTGGIAFGLVPQTIANKVYDEMSTQMKAKFKEQGVDAEVRVTGGPPDGPRPKSDFLVGSVVGAGAVGVGWLLWHFALSRFFKR